MWWWNSLGSWQNCSNDVMENHRPKQYFDLGCFYFKTTTCIMLDMTLWVIVCLSILVIFQKYWLPISFHEGCSSPGGGRAEYSQKGNPLQKENKLFPTRKLNSMWKAHANKSYCKWGDRWAWQPVLKMSCREKKIPLT